MEIVYLDQNKWIELARVQAGASFVATLHEHGLTLLFSGVLVTLLPVFLGAALGLWLLLLL